MQTVDLTKHDADCPIWNAIVDQFAVEPKPEKTPPKKTPPAKKAAAKRAPVKKRT